VRRPLPPVPVVLPLLLDRPLVAAAITSSLRTLDRMVTTGAFPPPDVRRGHFIRWKRETVEGWINAGGKCATPHVA